MLKLKNISFKYRLSKDYTLKELSLHIPAKSIFGFLGHNGAGKSTTIKVLAGLLKPQSGKISAFGHTDNKALKTIHQNTGFLIEEPGIYKHLTVEDNFKIWQTYYKKTSNVVNQILEITNLYKHSKKKGYQLSTGLKQRLGIAICLLKEPEFIVLDEPINGLDPQGILDVRNMIKNLNDEKGMTFLISSHILSEIEATCTHYGLLKNGKIISEGKVSEASGKNNNYKIFLDDKKDITTDIRRIISKLNNQNLVIDSNVLSLENCCIKTRNEIIDLLRGNQFLIKEIIKSNTSLEEFYYKTNNEESL